MQVKMYDMEINCIKCCFSESVLEEDIHALHKNLEKEGLSIILGSESCDFIITDQMELCHEAKSKKIPSLLYLHEKNRNQSIEGIPYAVESLYDIDKEYLIGIAKRFFDIPWTILETERLYIRELTEADLHALYEVYEDKSISLYTDDLYEDYDKELAYLKEYKKQLYEFCGMGIWALVRKSDLELIGRAGLAFREEFDTPELGYVVGVPYQRQGYAYEACKGILKYTKDILGFEEVRVLFQKENEASLRLCQKLGFQKQGEIRMNGVLMENYHV